MILMYTYYIMKYLKRDYKLLKFEKSKTKGKKYDGILQNKKTGKIVRLAFGAIGYETYDDKTKLNLYKTHNDKTRLKSFKSRFRKLIQNKDYAKYYTSMWFSNEYLW